MPPAVENEPLQPGFLLSGFFLRINVLERSVVLVHHHPVFVPVLDHVLPPLVFGLDFWVTGEDLRKRLLSRTIKNVYNLVLMIRLFVVLVSFGLFIYSGTLRYELPLRGFLWLVRI